MESKQVMKRCLTGVLAAVFLWTALPLPAARAAIVDTEAAVQLAQKEKIQKRLRSLLARDDIRQVLIAHGIDPAEARARVDSLTTAEAQRLAGTLDGLPAGGMGAIEALVFVFLLLLLTDLIGVTDVYPF